MKKTSVLLLTFGCQMNEYDSELVKSILSDAGYSFVEDESSADIILLNTCSVRENAHRKVYGYIHELRYRNRNRRLVIGIVNLVTHTIIL